MIATASHDLSAALWDAESGQMTKRFFHAGKVTRLLLSPDGDRLLTMWATPFPNEAANRVSLWDVSNSQELKTYSENFEGIIGFSPDGSVIPVVDHSGTLISLLDGRTGERLP